MNFLCNFYYKILVSGILHNIATEIGEPDAPDDPDIEDGLVDEANLPQVNDRAVKERSDIVRMRGKHERDRLMLNMDM